MRSCSTLVLLFAVIGCRREPLVLTCGTIEALEDDDPLGDASYFVCPKADAQLVALGDADTFEPGWVLGLFDSDAADRLCERADRIDVIAIYLPRRVEAPAHPSDAAELDIRVAEQFIACVDYHYAR